MKFVDNLKNWKHDIVANLKYYIIPPLAIFVLGIVMWIALGMNLGIDFTGGTAVSVQFGSQIEDENVYNQKLDEIKEVMKNYDLTVSLDQRMGEGESARIQVRFQNISGKSDEEMQSIAEALVGDLESKYPSYTVQNENRISASASSSLILNALLAVCIAMALIVVYLAIRFKKWTFGVCSIVSLLHDVLIMFSFMLIFHLEISSTFIAALITIIGYSINSNVIIFDRIRENLKLMPKESLDVITNVSIKQTLTRTLVTTFTTFLVVFVLLFVGISGITSFVLPITIGLVASFYSSVFISSALWAKMNKQKINK